jgi:hypothetical protein
MEIACLQLAGDIHYAENDLGGAIRHYAACVNLAAQDSVRFAKESETARESIQWPQSEVDVATGTQALNDGKDSQAVLDDLLLCAAEEADGRTAEYLYERIIPRLMQRDDKSVAFEAIGKSWETIDTKGPQAARSHLQLAQIFNEWEKYPDVVTCLQHVLSSRHALSYFGPCLQLATQTLTRYRADYNTLNWCQQTAKRGHHQSDVNVLRRHMDRLLQRMPELIVEAIRNGDFKPLCAYAEALFNNERSGPKVMRLYRFLLDSLDDSDIDTRTVQDALEDHMRQRMADRFRALAVPVRIVTADHERLKDRHAEAASILHEAFEIDSKDGSEFTRYGLDCAAHIAHAADKPLYAAYLGIAANSLLATQSYDARPPEEQEHINTLSRELPARLRPEDIVAAREQAQQRITVGGWRMVISDAKRFLNEIAGQGRRPLEGA